MMTLWRGFGLVAGVAVLASACVSHPMGPTVPVMAAPNKPFSVFENDVASCRNYADQQVAGQVERANDQALGGALLGAALGAGVGAAADGGRGAGIGAAAGGLVGTAVGAGGAEHTQRGIQHQYDNAYVQCMYAKGNQVPGLRPAVSTPAPPPPGSVAAPVSHLPPASSYPPPPPPPVSTSPLTTYPPPPPPPQ